MYNCPLYTQTPLAFCSDSCAVKRPAACPPFRFFTAGKIRWGEQGEREEVVGSEPSSRFGDKEHGNEGQIL
jgi:hypothetical protein